MSKIDEVIEVLKTLSEEDRKKLVDSFNKELNIQPVKKKRGRPTKKIQKETNSAIIPTEELKIAEEDDEVRRATELSKKIKKVGKKNVNRPSRPTMSLIKVRCLNCNREYEVASNFPSLHKFVCCHK